MMHNLRNIREVELIAIGGPTEREYKNFPCSFFEYLGGWQGYSLR